MAITSELARQALFDAGFEERFADLRGEGVGPIFCHSELPRPWSIIAAMNAGDAPAHVDVALQFRGQQVGTIHRVTSHPALVSNLPAIVSSLTALVGSEALTCPRCHEGWLAVGQSNSPDAQGPCFFCTDCWQTVVPGGAPNALQPIVTYRV
jgi:hypothetical protein